MTKPVDDPTDLSEAPGAEHDLPDNTPLTDAPVPVAGLADVSQGFPTTSRADLDYERAEPHATSGTGPVAPHEFATVPSGPVNKGQLQEERLALQSIPAKDRGATNDARIAEITAQLAGSE